VRLVSDLLAIISRQTAEPVDQIAEPLVVSRYSAAVLSVGVNRYKQLGRLLDTPQSTVRLNRFRVRRGERLAPQL
jgi:hypothetical protein